MIDPISLAQGALTSLLTEQMINAAKSAAKALAGKQDPPTEEETQTQLLAQIAAHLAPQEKYTHNYAMALQPYPWDYPIDENWYGKAHICFFTAQAFPLRIEVEGIGTYTNEVGPGWVQVDVRGRMSSNDAANHNILISYRDDALGKGI